MASLLRDLRYAFRLCFRNPGVTSVAIAALALGIGANSAIFTLVNAALIERPPFHDPDQIVMVWEETARRPGRPNVVGPSNFLRWNERATSFEQMAAFQDTRVNLTEGGTPEELIVQSVTPNFFATLGVEPLMGRTFSPDDGTPGRTDSVILSYELWQRRFGADGSIVGRTLQINGRPTRVAGVMPADIRLFVRGSLAGKPPDVWTPFGFTPAHREPRGRFMLAIARLKAGVPLATAQAEMRTIAAGLAQEFPRFDTGWSVLLVPVREALSGELRRPLIVLSGAAAFVLLIACANVANLLLARGAARQREISIRRALGASRQRIVLQLLADGVVLGVLGGGAGLLLAQWSVDALLALSPVDLAGLGTINVSYPVLAFTATVSIVTALVAGIVPAFEGSREEVDSAFKDGSRLVGAGVRQRRVRQLFVVSEIALAVVLLTGAALMIRSFSNLRRIDPGFDPGNVLTARVSLPGHYAQESQRVQFFANAAARIGSLPGVQSVGFISFLPFGGGGAGTSFTIVGQPPPAPGASPLTDVRVSDTGYFDAMRVPLVRGRLFTKREMQEKHNVVIVNETLANTYFAGVDPLAQRLEISMTDPITPTEIIGVVGDVRQVDLTAPIRPTVYWPHPQLAYSGMTFVIRTASAPGTLAPLVEREIQTMDREQPVADVRTMDQWIGRSLAQSRFNALLLAVFAAVALVLAAVGVYGVMSYGVSQRTAEIGVRLALGADQREILRMMMRSGARLTAAGLAAGLTCALLLSSAIAKLLYETRGGDPLLIASVVAILGAVSFLATYVPARRAARIEPVQALRYQ